ncbi:hypothetical protein RYZ69_26495, partial [Klebsiella pneumoniae]|nr:hypothetical protein [Klebsiella pneumoniae]
MAVINTVFTQIETILAPHACAVNECDILATVHVHAVINAINAIRMAGCVVLYLAVRNANEPSPVYFVVKRTTAARQPAGISPEFDA